MSATKKFDVLIVYSELLAKSASSPSRTPFSAHNTCNTAYAYFLKVADRAGLKMALTTTADITSPGTCSSYWIVKNGRWIKRMNACYSTLIFDKCAPSNKSLRVARNLLFASRGIKPYNHQTFYDLLYDKQRTHDLLERHAIPTVSLGTHKRSRLVTSHHKLSTLIDKHPRRHDFGSALVLKDRHGAGGNHVYKIRDGKQASIKTMMQAHPHISFVLQPFVQFERGLSFDGHVAATDIRLVYLGGKVVQSYVRRAARGDFRCNEHQGGTSTYIRVSDIPRQVSSLASRIATRLGNRKSLYALDFIMSNSGNVYFLEGNTGPGLNWNTSKPGEATMPQQLIRLIVQSLLKRIKRHNPPLRRKKHLHLPPSPGAFIYSPAVA